MAGFDWKALVRSVAPTLGTALGGPLAGSAVAAIATSLLGKPGTEDEIAAVLASASPEQVAAIKKADQEFAARMKEADVHFEEIAVRDRESARGREIATHDTWTPRIGFLVVTIGFFYVLGYIITHGVATDTNGGAIVLTLVGVLGTVWVQMCNYIYGSTSASRDKDATLASIAKG